MMLVVGSVLTMASIAWELARMNPQTSYLVEPWSTRGYESVHGSIIFTIGTLVLVTGLLTTFDAALKPGMSRGLAGLMGLAAIGTAAVYGTDDRAMGGGIIGWTLAIVAAYVLRRALAPVLPKLLPSLSSTAHAVIGLGIIIVGAFVLNLVLFGADRTAKPWVWIAIVSVLLVGLASVGQHAGLSANRMLIFSTVGGWLAIALSGAAARMNLLGAQLETSGIAGQYKDTQITSGYFLALLGMLIAFIGAVSLWATRRDVMINRVRAERQRAAAEASAAEIQAALELAQQHQREARSAK